jgi:hypothetical protein
MKWYLPTFYGDIRLERLERSKTRIVLVRLTPTEKQAATKLRETALAPPWRTKPWCEPEAFPPISELPNEHAVDLNAPLGKVQKLLSKALKPTRTLMDVVKFSDGRMEEVTNWPVDPEVEPGYRDSAKPEKPKPKPEAGTTVAQPTQGCPAPDFQKAEDRATEVLCAFLSREQVDDFNRHQRFVTVGADTGHRYMLTSRTARDQLGHFGGRSVYDLERRHALCVHDYTIPAPEELLSLHLFLSLPGRESYIRAIPEL